MRRVRAIKAELWLDHSNGAKMTPSQFQVYPATSVTSLLNVLLLRSPHAASRPQQRWQLAHCLLSSLCCHGPLGNILQVNWHLTGLVWCGMRGGWCCVLGVTYILRRQSLLVCWSTLCVRSVSCPLLRLPVFPHRSSPPARLTDRQMLSAVHLQLWASITLHKQPIARTQAANSVCLSPFR